MPPFAGQLSSPAVFRGFTQNTRRNRSLADLVDFVHPLSNSPKRMLVQVMKLANFYRRNSQKMIKKRHTLRSASLSMSHRVRNLDLALNPVKELAQLWNNRSTNTVLRAA